MNNAALQQTLDVMRTRWRTERPRGTRQGNSRLSPQMQELDTFLLRWGRSTSGGAYLGLPRQSIHERVTHAAHCKPVETIGDDVLVVDKLVAILEPELRATIVVAYQVMPHASLHVKAHHLGLAPWMWSRRLKAAREQLFAAGLGIAVVQGTLTRG